MSSCAPHKKWTRSQLQLLRKLRGVQWQWIGIIDCRTDGQTDAEHWQPTGPIIQPGRYPGGFLVVQNAYRWNSIKTFGRAFILLSALCWQRRWIDHKAIEYFDDSQSPCHRRHPTTSLCQNPYHRLRWTPTSQSPFQSLYVTDFRSQWQSDSSVCRICEICAGCRKQRETLDDLHWPKLSRCAGDAIQADSNENRFVSYPADCIQWISMYGYHIHWISICG